MRTVRVEERVYGSRTVLAVEPSDPRSFGFGERVIVLGDDGEERKGIVSWDMEARWVVAIEEEGTKRVPW
jgi:hypothetical protein